MVSEWVGNDKETPYARYEGLENRIGKNSCGLNSNSAIERVCHWQNEPYSHFHRPNARRTFCISRNDIVKLGKTYHYYLFLCACLFVPATNYNLSTRNEPKKELFLYNSIQDQRINTNFRTHACMINWRTSRSKNTLAHIF